MDKHESGADCCHDCAPWSNSRLMAQLLHYGADLVPMREHLERHRSNVELMRRHFGSDLAPGWEQRHEQEAECLRQASLT